MTTHFGRGVLLAIAAALLTAVWGPAQTQAAGKEITIAVVRDGPTEMNEIVDRVRPELAHLAGADTDVSFDMSGKYDAGWDPQRIRAVIETALRDRSVDIVMGIGSMVTYEAARPDLRLAKPFVSATLVDSDLRGVEFTQEGGLKENLGLVVQPRRTGAEIELVKRVMKPERVHVVVCQEVFDYIPGIEAALRASGEEIGVDLIPAPVSTEWRPVLERLGPDVEMVLFERTPRLSLAERAAFVEALNERGIPTFSGVGPKDLEIGMLGTNRPDITNRLVRRVALNLVQLIDGAPTEDLPVMLISDARLVINGETAAQIGFDLTFEASVLGTLLHPEALEAGADSLTVRAVLMMADSGNVALSISNQEVRTAERGKQVVRSPLFPQVGVGAGYNNLDNNLVGTLLPEQRARADLTLSQMIFDDRLISDFRSAGREYEAAMFQNDSDRLDVYLEAQTAFLLYVQTRLLHQIALENLRLTEGNLEIARVRVQVGHAGRDEEYRWTAELNQQRTQVMDIESLVETRRIDLNRILNAPMGKRWRPEPVDENSMWLELMRDRLGFALDSRASFDLFTEVAVDVALESSPERRFLQKSLESEGIQLGQRKRSFFVPQIFFDVNYTYNFWQDPENPPLADDFYELRVTAALPLFEGTRRWYDMQLSKSVIVELERRLQFTDQLVEQRTRNALRQIQASYPNIEFSRVAAENARRNFEVVRDKYANGIVNITDLISAQAASFTSDQNALAALYAFLLDTVDFQRAVAFFPEMKSPADIDQFVGRIVRNVEERRDR